MRTALADDDSLDFRLASRTGLVGASKYLQLIAVASLMFGDGIKVGFAGSQRGAQVSQSPLQHCADRPMKRPNLELSQGCRDPAGVDL